MKTFIIFSIALFSIQAQAQNNPGNSLSLKNCIEIALKNNINLERTNLQTETAELNFNETKSRVLPTINGNYSIGTNNGRSIDPFTNDIIDQQFNFSNAGISLNAQLFNGFELRNSIQRDRFKLQASEAEKVAAEQQLVLDVTLTYFQILNSKDLLELARLRLHSSQQQTDRLETLYKEGEGNPADFTDIKGQVNKDESNVMTAKNQLYQAKLNLAQLLNTNSEISVDEFNTFLDFKKYESSPKEVYSKSLENLATFEEKRLRIEAAKEDIAVARSLFAPDISLFAQLNTNFSSLASLLNKTGTQVVETGQFITIDNLSYPVRKNQSEFSEAEIPYLDQLNNNLSSVVGIAVDIPIFNGFRARRSVALKKIQYKDAELELENTKNDYFQAIKQAHKDMETAYENYFILKNQVEAYAESNRVNEIRFSSGVSNIVEYIISKNNLDQSRINLANAKYEYLIRTKILDYYKGDSF